ncbi:MAG: FecR domain-containing protein [Planctomycetota bacterium]
MDQPPAIIEDLAESLVADAITDDQIDQLDRMLTEQPEARARFVRYVLLHSDLHLALHAEESARDALDLLRRRQTVPPHKHVLASARRQSHWIGLGLVASLAASVAGLLILAPQTPKPGVSAQVNPQLIRPAVAAVEAVATAYDAADADWTLNGQPPATGERALAPGARLVIASGALELAFRSGPQVIVEGPATLRLLSDMELVLDSGRLTARVPQDALGFSVRAGSTRVIDLGTEFGVVAARTGRAEVAVFEGEVLVAQANGEQSQERLMAGQAAVSDLGRITEAQFSPEDLNLVRALPATPPSDNHEVIANYRRDYVTAEANQPTPVRGWQYLWNRNGPQGDPRNYVPLLSNGSFHYAPGGTGVFPGPDPAFSLHLREYGGHPGRDATASKVHEFGHGPVAAFTVSRPGRYRLVESWVNRLDPIDEDPEWATNEFGLDVMVHVNDRAPLVKKFAKGLRTVAFDAELGELTAGDTIYVVVGPNQSSRYDTFHWNFSIARLADQQAVDGRDAI